MEMGAAWCTGGQWSASVIGCNVALCRCRNGRLHGKCWKFLPGGGALYGNIGVDDKISGDDVVYLYPDFLTAIKVGLL